ncbi:hypothetical protein BBO99_00006833 [Phytophthora kernoviae]|uniref:Uncharacterized protein n=1 Tax=Phytophthora kernoviae TaxID=325452 RepID=A0A3R7IIA9_9STRA|nr:hypothetical protein JM16_005684 [Phytophthora kernoviae]RLN15279.1 hypothetical protein BBI17_006022 [Phytophthora kernoviae]RLN77339.1 hypothetical protein BBO99_00006833 [Phytophthora kernoviae]
MEINKPKTSPKDQVNITVKEHGKPPRGGRLLTFGMRFMDFWTGVTVVPTFVVVLMGLVLFGLVIETKNINCIPQVTILNEDEVCTPRVWNASNIEYHSGHRYYSAIKDINSVPLPPLRGKSMDLCDEKSRPHAKYGYCLPISGRKDSPFCTAADRMDLLNLHSSDSICYASVLHMIMVEVYEELQETGNSPFLAFGSLLGAVRNGSMVPFTEDSDIGFVGKLQRIDILREALWQKGYHMFFLDIWRVCVAPSHPLAGHLYNSSMTIAKNYAVPYLDLYMMRRQNDGNWDMQEFHGSNGRTLPDNKVKPFSQSLDMQSLQAREEKEAAQRERHRKYTADKRAAVKVALGRLREELTSLLTQQQSLLAAHWDRQCQFQQERQERPSSSPIAIGEPSHSEEKAESGTDSSTLIDEYALAVEVGNEIHLEHAALEKWLSKYDIFESLLHRDVPRPANEEYNPYAMPRLLQNDHQHFTSTLESGWKQFAEDEAPFYYEGVGVEICHNFVRAEYPSFLSRHLGFAQQEQILGAMSFFGWSVQRSKTADRQHFHVSKRISCINGVQLADGIANEAWRVFNTPELYEDLHHARVIMCVLQRVDANTSLIMQNIPTVDNSVNRRCLLVVSKIVDRDEGGHQLVGFLVLGVAPHEDMVEQFSSVVQFTHDVSDYFLLHHQVDEHGFEFVEMSLGGHSDYTSEAEANFVFLESVYALFQFERMVLPQVPLVTIE